MTGSPPGCTLHDGTSALEGQIRAPNHTSSACPNLHMQYSRGNAQRRPVASVASDTQRVQDCHKNGQSPQSKQDCHPLVSRFSLRHRDHRKRYSIVTPTGHACTEDSSRAGGTGMKIRCPPFHLQGRLTAVPEANPIDGTWYRYTAKCVAASDSQTRREQHPRSDFVIPQTVSTRRAVQTDHKSDQNPP